jgi:hypothetical protein
MKKLNILTILLVFLCITLKAQTISTYAGTGTGGYSGDGGPATAAMVAATGLTMDTHDNLYMGGGGFIRKVLPTGGISTFAGTGTIGYSGDNGPATLAKIGAALHIVTDKKGNVYFSTISDRRVRKVDTFGIITTYAGNGGTMMTGDGGPATNAEIGSIWDICIDDTGNIYISAHMGVTSRIRKVDTFGIIRPFAGSGLNGYSPDGSHADTMRLTGGNHITIDMYGNMLFVDSTRIRKIDVSGIVSTVAGSGNIGYSGDGGPAMAAAFWGIPDICVDACNNLYISDNGANRIRAVNSGGIINTVAGNGGSVDGGDGGPAIEASFGDNASLAFDSHHALYIATGEAVRKVAGNPDAGIIAGADSVCQGTTVTLSTTGNGGYWASSNTAATVDTLGRVAGVAGGVDTIYYIKQFECQADTARHTLLVKSWAACHVEAASVNPQQATLRIWPNPNHGTFTLSLLHGSAHVVITDMVGVKTKELDVAGNEQQEIRLLPGIYLINAIAADGTRYVGRVVVQ